MDRLTAQWGKNHAVPTKFSLDFAWDISKFEWQELVCILDRLAAYEDTGLEPDEIPHWILASERMPEEHEIEQDVCDPETLAVVDVARSKCSDLLNVVVIDDETCKKFVCDDVTVNGKWVNFPDYRYTVTHWQPLPQPPKENP